MRSSIATILMILLLATPCFAVEQRTVGTYKRHMNSDEHNAKDLDHNLHHMLYLTGIHDGYAAVNQELTSKGAPPLYCQPHTKELSGQDCMTLFEQFIYSHEDPKINALTIPDAMLQALRREFPCPSVH